MKRVAQLDGPPAGLADYLANGPAPRDWNTLRDHADGSAYRELIGALDRVQHGLCAYCEIRLTKDDREVEHLHPKSDDSGGIDWAFRIENLFAACKGASQRWFADPSRFLPPIRENLSCGAAKGERVLDGSVLKPSELPASPPLFRVVASGAIQADPDACRSSGIDVALARNTIDRLNLDCARLTNGRAEVWRKLEDDWLAEVARTAGIMPAMTTSRRPCNAWRRGTCCLTQKVGSARSLRQCDRSLESPGRRCSALRPVVGYDVPGQYKCDPVDADRDRRYSSQWEARRRMLGKLTSVVHLSPAEKLRLVDDLWDDLGATPDAVPVHGWQKAELVCRKENLRRAPASGLSWERVQRRVRARHCTRKPAS